ncbi:MAG: hypothetical protein BWY25_01711 [Chloroflexi bacterium ADurb.Bin222]|nr:MAG: hypothetical protein BWY25_01711 [Chloroflexi bacterium ADurb.Bin222]
MTKDAGVRIGYTKEMEFKDWLAAEMRARELGVRELARRARNGPGTVSRILHGVRTPGPAFCKAIAQALELPEEEVLERAGIITRPSLSYTLFSQLNDAQQEGILQEMRALVEENRRTRRVTEAEA